MKFLEGGEPAEFDDGNSIGGVLYLNISVYRMALLDMVSCKEDTHVDC